VVKRSTTTEAVAVCQGSRFAAGASICRSAVLSLFVLILLIGIGRPAWAASIKVYPDRAVAAVNESFRLTFEADGAVDGEPDFTPLSADFEILGRSQRSSISIVNGSVHKAKVWVLNLIAKRAGQVTIPSISFGSNRSEAQTIEVQATSSRTTTNASEQMSLEVEVSPRDPYVQQQVLYTVRLYRDNDVDLSDASLGEPKLSNGGSAIVQQLGKDRLFRTQRGDAQLQVVERTYALFPQQSGATEIEPILFQAQVVKGTASLFDPFAQSVETKRLQTERVPLTVKPIPKTFSGKHWLPAKELRLAEIWSADPPVFRLDEPITRTRTLVATGLTAGQLPELGGGGLDVFKSYPDRPVLDDQKKTTGVAGIREEKLVLIPAHAGSHVLPAMTIPWWNTETDREEFAQLPERRFEVPAAPGKPAVTGPAVAPVITATAVPDRASPSDLIATELTTAWPWRVISMMLAAGWLITVLVWWRTRRAGSVRLVEQLQTAKRLTVKQDIQSIVDAARSNDAQATKEALLGWAKARWPACPPTSLGSLGERCDPDLAEQLLLLNSALYRQADPAEPWSGGAVLATALQAFIRQRTEMTPAPAALEPLHKSVGVS
jgi:hypothetical protein